MVAGFSKAVTLYLVPVLGLAATLLSLFAILAPTLLLHDRVNLLVVSPSTALSQSGPSRSTDGPSVFLCVLGSCSRPSSNASITCILPALEPKFDLRVLPANEPCLVLSAPSAVAPAFIARKLTAFLIVRMWFGTAVKDFNATILEQGAQGHELVAEIGNGFTMVYVAHAFYAVPVISLLTKFNVKLTK
ncbi:hypothetical protein FA15DRAFT_676815 [Coprinopsis marcescibilis]|uniref:Uncharacterized protein n=1 Tax=Coprinopsis marcescibilis TaxID=230819 RepID=A0A5C3LBM9_COPMA|nr:hypothetical protein FA15DRAFT_676815 [Coprinopsis marcescibilis]